MMTNEAVLAAIDDQDIRFVELWFTDIMGAVKNVTLTTRQVRRALEYGINFDGSAVDGFARVAESDMLLRPDTSTFTLLPWSTDEERTARMICNVYTPQGEPFIGDPRYALIRMLNKARAMGFTFKIGLELEYFLFELDENGLPVVSKPYDDASYFDASTGTVQSVRRRMINTLEAMGVRVESTHSEIGLGQHEFDLQYTAALKMADRMSTARVAMKAACKHSGLYCTFMPRPVAGMPGSGLHTHQSLHDAESDENVFVDLGHEYGLSQTARYFLAGQLYHARAMAAILAPLVNSYKRLGTSFEAPVYVSWAHINRAALIRVPSVLPGMEAHTRLELRCPDPSANPYLAAAVMLAAGLDGIEHRMALPDPLEETLLTQKISRLRKTEVLPASLGEALELLSQNEVILAALGPYIGDRYLEAKRQEVEEYQRYVTQWELERYLKRY